MNPRALVPLLAALAALALACAPRFDPRLVDVPNAGRPWVSTEQVRHPLVGKIWDVRAGRFVDEPTLDAALAGADFVALGETHDNPDHHLLQARLLRAITASGRRPALVFAMLDSGQQAAVDAALAEAPRDPDQIGRAVGWDKSGWPEFRWYRPIFAAGLEAGLPIVAANLSRAKLKEVRTKGRDALDEGVRVRLARDEPVPASMAKSLRAEMEASHCGELPESMLDPLVLSQRARDAAMAEAMTTAGARRGAVLIAGKGHARNDRGVPAVVGKDEPGKRFVSVAFVEVDPDRTDPATYHEDEDATGPAPFDFLVFTAGVEREDPCEAMRAHMEKRRAAEQKAAKDAPAKTPGPGAPSVPAPAPAQ